ncbi:hypothetical protein EG328_004411 [Venturia inaequalis]|uniref:Uncharacterized protein n=1 Tax=Venturia inaequalis TaxID=5025 RepID=A0A8H3YVI2_VENIN|nr:hypothetical protein EG328_004411 [Venturia inaequalis]
MKSSMQVKQALPVECRKKGGKEVMHELLRDLKAFLEEMGVELTLRTAADIPLVSEELYASIKELIVLKGKLPAIGSTDNNPGAIARITKKAREIIAYADT